MKQQFFLIICFMSCMSMLAKQPNQQSNQSNDNRWAARDNDENRNNNILPAALIQTNFFDIRRVAIPADMHPQTLSNRARVDQYRRDIIDRGNAEVYGGIMPASRNTSGSPVPTE